MSLSLSKVTCANYLKFNVRIVRLSKIKKFRETGVIRNERIIMAHSGAIRKTDSGLASGKFYNIDGGSSSDGDQDDGYHNYKSSIHASSRIRSPDILRMKTC